MGEAVEGGQSRAEREDDECEDDEHRLDCCHLYTCTRGRPRSILVLYTTLLLVRAMITLSIRGPEASGVFRFGTRFGPSITVWSNLDWRWSGDPPADKRQYGDNANEEERAENRRNECPRAGMTAVASDDEKRIPFSLHGRSSLTSWTVSNQLTRLLRSTCS